MIIVDKDKFDAFIKAGIIRSSIKFVCIMDKFYAVCLSTLWESMECRKLPKVKLDISQDLLDSFPPPRHNLDYINLDFLYDNPVIMFETAEYDDVYFRFDGRHRLIGAHRLGLKQVWAKWIPRNMWAKHIIGVEVEQFFDNCAQGISIKERSEPLAWDRSPLTKQGDDDYHVEPNFELPFYLMSKQSQEDKTAFNVKRSIDIDLASNSGSIYLFSGSKQSSAKVEQPRNYPRIASNSFNCNTELKALLP